MQYCNKLENIITKALTWLAVSFDKTLSTLSALLFSSVWKHSKLDDVQVLKAKFMVLNDRMTEVLCESHVYEV